MMSGTHLLNIAILGRYINNSYYQSRIRDGVVILCKYNKHFAVAMSNLETIFFLCFLTTHFIQSPFINTTSYFKHYTLRFLVNVFVANEHWCVRLYSVKEVTENLRELSAETHAHVNNLWSTR